MRNAILSATLFAIASITSACQPSNHARPTSGIELHLSSTVEGGSLYSRGRLRVQSLDTARSGHLLVGPPTYEQRLELPPGAYSVAYEPLARRGALGEQLGTMKVVSRNPLIVVVGQGKFTPLNVRVIDAEAEPLARSESLASAGGR
ncbi:MAG: hypothetical protein ABW217_15635 [Polyangiaceae bacterium]